VENKRKRKFRKKTNMINSFKNRGRKEQEKKKKKKDKKRSRRNRRKQSDPSLKE